MCTANIDNHHNAGSCRWCKQIHTIVETTLKRKTWQMHTFRCTLTHTHTHTQGTPPPTMCTHMYTHTHTQMYSTWTLYVHPHIHTYMVWRCMIVCVHCVCLCMLANWAHVVGIETESCGQQQTFHMLLSDYRLDSVCECHSIYWSARLKLESAFHHPQRLHFPHCLVGWLTIDTNLCSRLTQIFPEREWVHYILFLLLLHGCHSQ